MTINIVGFTFLGKDFIRLWLGAGFDDAYTITLILIVPSIFEYCINTALSILKAKNKLGFRTIVLIISCLLNLVTTIVLVKKWSYIGAAVGTSVSYFICSLFIMNAYYAKELRLPMVMIYKSIIKGLWICLLIAGMTLHIYSVYYHGTLSSLIGGVAVFCMVYFTCLITIGLSKDEKRSIPVIGKFF